MFYYLLQIDVVWLYFDLVPNCWFVDGRLIWTAIECNPLNLKTMKSVILSFFCLALLAFSCEQNDPVLEPGYEEGQAFELAFGATASCTCGAPDITFADVVADSRCPLNVECIWEGEVIVKLSVDGEDVQLGLSSIDTAPEMDTIGQWSVQLLEVNPYPEDPVEIPEEDYELKLIVEAI